MTKLLMSYVIFGFILNVLTCVNANQFPHSNDFTNKVLLSEVTSLSLQQNKFTTGRRNSPIPQLNCVKGYCEYGPNNVMCKNVGKSDIDFVWECTGYGMTPGYLLTHSDVSCEGYNDKFDPYILRGSCAVFYGVNKDNSYTKPILASSVPPTTTTTTTTATSFSTDYIYGHEYGYGLGYGIGYGLGYGYDYNYNNSAGVVLYVIFMFMILLIVCGLCTSRSIHTPHVSNTSYVPHTPFVSHTYVPYTSPIWYNPRSWNSWNSWNMWNRWSMPTSRTTHTTHTTTHSSSNPGFNNSGTSSASTAPTTSKTSGGTLRR